MVKQHMPVWVAAVALLDGGGRVLMQRRPEGREHGGLWEFPGGKVEPGESGEMAARRELAEELGVVVEPADLAPVGFASNGGAGGRAVQRKRERVYTLPQLRILAPPVGRSAARAQCWRRCSASWRRRRPTRR